MTGLENVSMLLNGISSGKSGLQNSQKIQQWIQINERDVAFLKDEVRAAITRISDVRAMIAHTPEQCLTILTDVQIQDQLDLAHGHRANLLTLLAAIFVPFSFMAVSPVTQSRPVADQPEPVWDEFEGTSLDRSSYRQESHRLERLDKRRFNVNESYWSYRSGNPKLWSSSLRLPILLDHDCARGRGHNRIAHVDRAHFSSNVQTHAGEHRLYCTYLDGRHHDCQRRHFNQGSFPTFHRRHSTSFRCHGSGLLHMVFAHW